MKVAEAPLIPGAALAATYKVGRAQGAPERTLRTMRDHGFVTAGLVEPITAGLGRLAGRVTYYSVLNRDAAALARAGYEPAAKRLARRAYQLEHSEPTRKLARHMTTCIERAAGALSGFQDPEKRLYATYRLCTADAGIQQLLRTLSESIESAREASRELRQLDQRTSAHVVRVGRTEVQLRLASGEDMTAPRAMLGPRGLDVIGTPVVVHREVLPSGELLLSAFPAVELDVAPRRRASPFEPMMDLPPSRQGQHVSELAPLLRDWAANSAPATPRAS